MERKTKNAETLFTAKHEIDNKKKSLERRKVDRTVNYTHKNKLCKK